MGSLDVLILSVDAGAGHLQAAKSVKSALEKRGIKAQIEDGFRFGPKWVFQMVIGSYLKTLDKSPGLYRFLYTASEKKNTLKASRTGLATYLKRFLGNGMRRYLKENQPKVIICTHPFPLVLLTRFKREGWLKAPLFGVVTDFTIHPFWTFPEVHAYFLATSDMLNELEMLGESRFKGIVTGIPINEAFGQVAAAKSHREVIEQKLGIASAPFRILAMGGSLGLGPLEYWIEQTLAVADSDLQLVVVTGRNELLYNRLREYYSHDSRLVLFGFTKEVPALMAISDLLATKPGGLTSSEALALGLPQLLFSPLPGHEERNFDYLIRSGVAVSSDSVEGLARLAVNLHKHPQRLEQIACKARFLGSVDAAEQVAEEIHDLLYHANKIGIIQRKRERWVP